MRDDLDRLDPAWKSLCFSGFTTTDKKKRSNIINTFFETHFKDFVSLITIQHISKGPYNDRKMTSMSLVELPNRIIKDQILKMINDQNLQLNSQGETVKITYAKTKRQLLRNSCVRRAEQLIKESGISTGKNVVSDWKAGKGKQTISVDGKEAFIQDASDSSGHFLPPHTFLKLM